jgi:hypothetical protein
MTHETSLYRHAGGIDVTCTECGVLTSLPHRENDPLGRGNTRDADAWAARHKIAHDETASAGFSPGVDFSLIPEHMVDGIVNYVQHGIPPGGFLHALLSNDLVSAWSRGDDENRRYIGQWVTFLINYVPSLAWGSEEKVGRWIAATQREAR